MKYCGLELGKRRLHTGEVETKGKYKGQKRKESWYRLAKLKKLKSITILDDPDAVDNTPCPEEKEKPKPKKVIVLLQHLLPHYKKPEELKPLNDSDECGDSPDWECGNAPDWGKYAMLEAIVSMANSSAAAAKASAQYASAASSLATISLSMFDRKRGLGKGVGSNESKKQRI